MWFNPMRLTLYETIRLAAEPFLPLLYARSRSDLKRLVAKRPRPVTLLDVGGRKSPYTIGLPAQVTITELPRESALQNRLNLGLTSEAAGTVRQRRSNVKTIVFEDMTRCTLPSSSFDGVVCVEVIEHVQDDERFVRQIDRVLKPSGFLYLTTPNGDYIKNVPPHYNPDHVRHYTRLQLAILLQQYFESVEVTYGVKTGIHRVRGLQSLSVRRPATLLTVPWHNICSRFESRGLQDQAQRTAHLFAVAVKGK